MAAPEPEEELEESSALSECPSVDGNLRALRISVELSKPSLDFVSAAKMAFFSTDDG